MCMCLAFHLCPSVQLPFIAAVEVSFLEQPEINFDLGRRGKGELGVCKGRWYYQLYKQIPALTVDSIAYID